MHVVCWHWIYSLRLCRPPKPSSQCHPEVISSALFSINQVKHILPKDCLRTLYYSLIHSHLSYGLLTWGNCDRERLYRAVNNQKRAIRTINNAKFRSHTDPLFKASRILKILDHYVLHSNLFVFHFIAKDLTQSFNRNIPGSLLT